MTEHAEIQTVEGDAAAHERDLMLPADPMVSMIERITLDPNADLDKLKQMLAMKERIDARNDRIAFAHALSAARAEIPPIIKDATVDFSSQKGRTYYRHETLAGIAKTVDPILSKNGLSYRFGTDQADGRVIVTCIVSHKNGYTEETTLSGLPDQSGSKNSFQAVGSAVTYLQRYTLKAALGLSAEVDDDGQAAAPRDESPKFDGQAAAGRIVSRIEQANTLDDLASLWRDEADIIKRIKTESPDEFSRLEGAKNTTKARLSEGQDHTNDGRDYVEAIDYYGANYE